MAFIPANIGGGESSTPITPSNSSPASMTANTVYKPTANGYAVETVGSATASNTNPPAVGVDVPIIMSSATGRQSVRIVDSITEVTPSNSSPVMLSANSIAQIKDAGVAISSYTGITPSNTSPVSLSSGSIYKPSASGYAISSYSSKTPSDTSPASVSSGAIIKASSAGYLYKTLQTLTETTLWTNSSPTSTFAGQTVTLSQSSANFTYIKVYFRCTTSDSTTYDSGLIDIADYDASTGSSSAPRFVMAVAMTNAFARMFNKATNTTLTFGQARQWSQSTNVNTYCVPTKVVGVK